MHYGNGISKRGYEKITATETVFMQLLYLSFFCYLRKNSAITLTKYFTARHSDQPFLDLTKNYKF